MLRLEITGETEILMAWWYTLEDPGIAHYCAIRWTWHPRTVRVGMN